MGVAPLLKMLQQYSRKIWCFYLLVTIFSKNDAKPPHYTIYDKMCDDSVRVFFSDSVEDITFTKTFLHLLEPENSSRNSYDSFAVAIIENDALASRVQFLALSYRSSYSMDSSVSYQFVPFRRDQSRCSYGLIGRAIGQLCKPSYIYVAVCMPTIYMHS